MPGCVRPPSLDDVRDACDACAFAKTESERRDCFEVFGLDVKRVDQWLEPVLSLERTWEDGSMGHNKDDEAHKRIVSFGTVVLCLLLGVRLF